MLVTSPYLYIYLIRRDVRKKIMQLHTPDRRLFAEVNLEIPTNVYDDTRRTEEERDVSACCVTFVFYNFENGFLKSNLNSQIKDSKSFRNSQVILT